MDAETPMLLLIAMVGAVYLWLASQLGANSLNAACLLLWRGCVRVKQATWRAGIAGLAVVQPARLGGVTIFEAESVKFRRLGWSGLYVRFHKPRINFKGDRQGMLHLVALLQDVGFVGEAKARELPPELRDSPLTKPPELQAKVHTASFSGEAHISAAHLSLREGQLDLPFEVGQILGDSLKATLAVGTANVARAARKLATSDSAAAAAAAATGDSSGAAAEAGPWWEQPPGDFSGRLRYPVLLRLQSATTQIDAAGWRCDTGLRLQRPIAAAVHFTPEIAQLMLTRLHPLLGSAVRLQGQEVLRATLTPVGLHLPADMVQLRLEPMKLLLQTKKLVKGLFRLLNAVGLKDWEDPNTMVACTSVIATDVFRSGLLVSKRMDLLLGHRTHDAQGFHCAMWGSINANTNCMSFVLGLPAATLRRLGAPKSLDPAYVFQIPVEGSSDAPSVDWLRAGKDLAEVLLKGRLQEGLPALGRLFARRSRKEQQQRAAPPPHHPLPWEAFAAPQPPKSGPAPGE